MLKKDSASEPGAWFVILFSSIMETDGWPSSVLGIANNLVCRAGTRNLQVGTLAVKLNELELDIFVLTNPLGFKQLLLHKYPLKSCD